MLSDCPCYPLLNPVVPLQFGPGSNPASMAGKNQAGPLVIHWQEALESKLGANREQVWPTPERDQWSTPAAVSREPAQERWLNNRNSETAEVSYSSSSTTSPALPMAFLRRRGCGSCRPGLLPAGSQGNSAAPNGPHAGRDARAPGRAATDPLCASLWKNGVGGRFSARFGALSRPALASSRPPSGATRRQG